MLSFGLIPLYNLKIGQFQLHSPYEINFFGNEKFSIGVYLCLVPFLARVRLVTLPSINLTRLELFVLGHGLFPCNSTWTGVFLLVMSSKIYYINYDIDLENGLFFFFFHSFVINVGNTYFLCFKCYWIHFFFLFVHTRNSNFGSL